jgi:hypothetical protein
VTSSEIARIAKWSTHEAMCLIEYLVSVGAMTRRSNNIRRYAINPDYKGDVWTVWFQ